MHVYLAYFDLLTGDLRFQGGAKESNTKYGTLQDPYNVDTVPKDTQNDSYTLQTTAGERSYLQVVATSDGKDTSGNAYQKSGEYVSIGVTSGNTVAMVWYNGKDLLYSYNSTPSTTRTGVTRDGWTAPVTLLSNAGKYCQLVVDSDDNIHVAAWDSAKGDLKYVYIPKANLADLSASNVISCTVDSYGTVGRELTIDVAKVGNNQIPYIGYFANTPKKPRYAYLANPPATYSSASLAGVSSGDLYTGVWECTIAPTLKVNGTGANATLSADKNVVTLDEKTRRINVGVWKYNGTADDNGKLAYSTTGPNRGKTNGTNSYTSSTNIAASTSGGGMCYGNGSRNGVLAYGVRYTSQQDYVETAQKR